MPLRAVTPVMQPYRPRIVQHLDPDRPGQFPQEAGGLVAFVQVQGNQPARAGRQDYSAPRVPRRQ